MNIFFKHPTVSKWISRVKCLPKKQLALAGLVAGLIFLVFIPMATYAYYYFDIRDKNRLLNSKSSGLLLLDREGEPFFSFYQARSETYIPLEEIPVHVQEALIAAEDKDYYEHSGFSIRGIARAFYVNVINRKVVQGGSTITQELVKNALLTSDQTILRKYQELTLALAINQRYSKGDILEMYLNSVYFGAGAFGIEDAAQTYFGIPAKELTVAQAALLIGILPAPSALSPLDNDPDLAKDKQRIVLLEMAEDQYISDLEATRLASEPLDYQPKSSDLNTLAPHFALYIRDLLIEEYGEEKVIRSGFKVKTTLNRTFQDLAQTTVQKEIARLARNKASNGAVVALDPKTGQILAMVGSYDWHDAMFGTVNMAISPRQPGSSFKPIIYAAAMEQDLITPATVLEDKPKEFPGGYKPQNYDRRFRGFVTVRRALANSLNIPAVEVMEELGVYQGLIMAEEMGITTLTESPAFYGLPLVLGAGEVPLLELTGAYSIFANQGNKEPIVGILEIQDKYGKMIQSYESKPERVLSEETAYLISSILSDSKARAETFGNSLTISRTAAAKTGTTNDYKDALTVGYTPSLVIGVWVGNNDHTSMDSVAGSLGAAPIWRQLMEMYLKEKPNEPFPIPRGVRQLTVCPFAQVSDNVSTSSGYLEYFSKGSEPDIPCPSPSPTSEPTSTPEPSAEPTATASPTETPTAAPQTSKPTSNPTATPGPTPIITPEITPLVTPLLSPSPTPVVQIDL